MSEVFSILLHNRQRYEQGKEGLWFSLPTTTEKLQETLREIGISADNPQDFFLYDYRSPQERPIKLPRDLVLSADVDELNFLAARLEKLDAAELAELNAALTSPQSDFRSIGQIIDYPDNVDYYVHLPDVTGTGQLGDYYLNRSGMVDMPEEWKAGIFLPRFGLHIANTEHGVFTDYGYLVKSGDEWQRVHEGQPVLEEYRVMAYPAPEILRDEAPARTVQPEAAPTAEAAAPPPVVPIILNSQNSADRMKEITDRLETGIQELFESERYKAYLTSMAKFHSYSFNNTLLIAMQGGQLVAGYNKWRDDFHRNVKRGEKGIKILAPAPYKVKKEVPKLDEQGKPVMDKDGKPLTEVQETQVPAFKIVSVFDVSQTEGEPLPSIGVDELAGNVEQYEDFFKALEQTSPVPMAFEDIPGGSHGYYHLTEKRIAIQENMSELQTLKTAIHEIAHAKLHAIDPEAPVTEQADRPDSRTREVQAESVAYAVCQHYGLDTSDYSFGYVAGWSSGKDLKELRASLETIRATAHELITAIDGHLAELQQQRQAQQAVEQAAEQPAPDSVFSKLPPEQQQEMTDSVKAMLQTLIDADVKSTGEVTQGTLDAIQTQGFVLSGDGTLQRAEAQEAAYRLESGNILFIQTSENGFDYTVYGPDYKEIDGGQLDNTEYSLSEARDEILSGIAPQGHVTETITGDALEDFQEAAEQANAISVQPEPQPWNGIDGLLNNKPIMPEATPTERANALIDWAERDGQRMESKDGMSAADILHVRAGQNYLVEDFTRMERLRSDPVVLESLSRVAQEIGFDRVRPYVVENGSYKAMPDMPFTQWENPYFTVDPPAQEQGDTFTIYQLKGGPETRDYRFEAYESLQEAGLAVDRQNYDLIYTAPLDGKTTLEDIYRTFNLDRPADFTGHSLSVSDVVVLNRSGKEEAHYCDSFGFTPVPEFFLQREKQLTPRELLTGESIQTPRGSFLVTDMSREQLEAAGYGFHHQSEDGKYLIMGNGTDAFAIPAQQESPIKAAEMTTEQNYNMIDGVLNNAPTMSELEAKAKAGEQISLFDVAEAAKAEAQKPKQPQRPAQKQKKPSIRAQLKAAKEEQQKKPPQREKAQELEV